MALSARLLCGTRPVIRSAFQQSRLLVQPTNQLPALSSHRYMCDDVRKVDITSGRQTFIFDTHKAVKLLENNGVNTVEAEGMVELLSQIMSANMDHVNKNLVTKPQQEIAVQQIMAHIGALRKDMVILEKSEFSLLKHEYEKQKIEVDQLKKHMKDEISKLDSGVKLDINLEKARAKEAHSMNAQELSHLMNRIEMEKSENNKVYSVLDSKIDREVATLLATYERYRNDVIKYAAGTILTCLTICLGFYRIWM